MTEAQLEEGLRFQAEHNRRIGEVAVQRGLLTPDQVRVIRDRQQGDPRLFGDIAVGARQLSRRVLDDLLFFQKVHHTYLGEALLVLGHISHEAYQRLLGQYYAMKGEGQVNLRYLQDFFAENKIVEIVFEAFVRLVLRCAGEEAQVSDIGGAFAADAYPVWYRLEGTILDGRALEVHLGLSDVLAARLGADDAEGLDCAAGMLLRYCIEMLRDASFVLEDGTIARETWRDVGGGDCLRLRCLTPTGEAAMVLCLQDAAP